MSKIKDRISELAKALGYTAKEFGMSVGCSHSWASNITKSIGSDILDVIVTKYPSVNLYWLVTGIGEMFIPTAEENKIILTDRDTFYAMVADLRRDNADLRKENAELRSQLLQLTQRNADLLLENVKLRSTVEISPKN